MEGLAINKMCFPHRDFWHGRRVFITGHTGFKGSWLSLWLQHLGVDLTGYALKPPTSPSLFNEAEVSEGMRSIDGDVLDAAQLKKSMQSARPEIVIHMAAQALVRYSYQNPVETYATNVMGTVHLLEAVRSTPSVRAVINVTSDKCYENREWEWAYREIDSIGGFDPYSNSKGCSEMVTASYRSSYFNAEKYDVHGVAVGTVRAGNVIGGGDWAQDRLIPDTISAFEKKQTVRIRNPHAIRPWQHVLEPLSGYLMLAEKLFTDGPAFAQAWNFGPRDEDARPVAWMVERVAELWGDGADWVIDESPQPHEANYLKLDCSKSISRLGWHPRLGLSGALKSIVDWHKGHVFGASRRGITLEQIQQYISSSLGEKV